jgi:hypothetical protein
MNGNYTDLFVNGGRNISYRHTRSEGATAAIVLGTSSTSGAHDLTIEENSFAGAPNGSTTISFPYNTTGAIIRLIKNDWDANSTVTPFGPTGSGAFTGVLDSQDNNYPNATLCVAVPSSGLSYSVNDGPFGACYGGIRSNWRVIAAGGLQTTPTVFSNLPTCTSSVAGTLQGVSNSTTNTWGASTCDGTNWTVAAK